MNLQPLVFNYKDLDDFGINATTTKNMYKGASMESLDFSKSNFEKLTNTEGMYENFTQDYWSRDKFNLPTAKTLLSLLIWLECLRISKERSR